MYSKKKAAKLVKEFAYLKGKEYKPYGKDGKTTKIKDVRAKVTTAVRGSIIYYLGEEPADKKADKRDVELANGNNWWVEIVVNDDDAEVAIELEEALKKMGISHNIKNIPN